MEGIQSRWAAVNRPTITSRQHPNPSIPKLLVSRRLQAQAPRTAMTSAAPTIPSLKESFITAQTNILSQPVAPSHIWRRNNTTSSNPIPARVLDDVLFNLNQTIQLHQRRVYPPQATYNVAEQITNLYTRDAEEKVKKWKESESSIVRELDLGMTHALFSTYMSMANTICSCG